MQRPPIKALAAAALAASMWTVVSAHASPLAAQTSQTDGVSIQVTPINVAVTASEWKFAVTLDTHSGNLGDDVAAEAFLVDGAGTARPALGWDGDSPGGHHRRGVLRFAALSPQPAQIELHIRRASEPAARTFRWPAE